MRNLLMLPEKNVLRNEDGFVLVTGLMIMTILSLIGLAATNTTIFEMQIAGNDKVATKTFFLAEAAAYEGAQRLENENDPDNLKAARTALKWLETYTGSFEDNLLNVSSSWEEADGTANPDYLSGIDQSGGEVSLAAIDHGVVKGGKGSSLKMTGSKVYLYHLLGHASLHNGKKTIEIGYKKRY